MKKHILIYESIEIGLKYSFNLILISELFAWILDHEFQLFGYICLAKLKASHYELQAASSVKRMAF